MGDRGRADGPRMPAEWEPHDRCWMAWPCRPEGWRRGLAPARDAVARVVQAIADHEPVSLLVRAEDHDDARRRLGGTADLIVADLDDSWTRDTGPTFVIDGDGRLAGVDWGFNAWGLIYDGFARDARLARQIIARAGARRIVGPQVLEGGSIHVDGEGTLVTTEQCLLDPQRNPHLTKADIETHLRGALGVETVIWLPRGLTDDETRGHVDNLCCFSAPGQVLLPATADPADPDHAVLAEARAVLERAVDARGRTLGITTLPVPPRRRSATGEFMALSYVNFYLANGAVIMPGFSPETDGEAADTLSRAFPGRRVVVVPGHGLAEGGGNVHCITQQQPRAAEAANRERSGRPRGRGASA